MKLIQLQFETLKDRDKVAKEYNKRNWGYRSYNRNNKYYIEFGKDK